MNVTAEPAQNGFVGAEIVTPAAKDELTTMVTGLDITGLPLTQAAFDVNLHVTTSPLVGIYV